MYIRASSYVKYVSSIVVDYEIMLKYLATINHKSIADAKNTEFLSGQQWNDFCLWYIMNVMY